MKKKHKQNKFKLQKYFRTCYTASTTCVIKQNSLLTIINSIYCHDKYSAESCRLKLVFLHQMEKESCIVNHNDF